MSQVAASVIAKEVVLDVYPQGDVHYRVIGINSAQSETSAWAKLMSSHVSPRQCIIGDLNLLYYSYNSVELQKLRQELSLRREFSRLKAQKKQMIQIRPY